MGIKKTRRKGDPVRPASFGYRVLPKEKGQPRKWIINIQEAKTVKTAFSLALAGKTCPQILKALNEIERKPSSGRIWSRVRLLAMFQNEVYKGDILANKYYIPDYITKKLVKNQGEYPQIYVEGHHEAIICHDDFDRLQMMIREGMLSTRNKLERIKKLRSIGIEVNEN